MSFKTNTIVIEAAADSRISNAIGINVQAQSLKLDDLAALTLSVGNFIIGNGSTFSVESGATARTSMGLGSIAVETVADFVKSDGSSIITASMDLNSQKIINLATPTVDADAATKAYVDGIATGLDLKGSVRVTTTANITLSSTQTVDTVVLIADDRVLVKDQTTQTENGIYDVKSGAWVRSSDSDNTPGNEVSDGLFTFVEEGSQSGSGWVLISPNGNAILGTDDLIFTQFSNSTSSVSSVFGRTSVVLAASDDYTASQITNVINGNIMATDVQSAINELDSEKLALTGGTLTGALSASTITTTGDITASGILLDVSADRLLVGNGTNSSTAIIINSTATGSPFIQFEQAGTAKAFIQYADSGDILKFDADGDIEMLPGNTSAATFKANGDFSVNSTTLNKSLGRLFVGDGTNSTVAIIMNSTATGSPFLQFEQAGEVKANMIYLDAVDALRIESDGSIDLRAGNLSSLVIASNQTVSGPSIATAAEADAGSVAKLVTTIGLEETRKRLRLVTESSSTSITATGSSAGEFLRTTSASAVTVTLTTTSAWTRGDILIINQYGAGQVTVAGTAITLRTPGSLKTRARYSQISITFISNTEAIVGGDLE